MRISTSASSGFQPPRREPCDSARACAAPVRALLPAIVPPAEHAAPADAPQRTRPAAALLAQLVAANEDLPVSRVRRRADPAAGVRIYRTIADLAPKSAQPASRIF